MVGILRCVVRSGLLLLAAAAFGSVAWLLGALLSAAPAAAVAPSGPGLVAVADSVTDPVTPVVRTLIGPVPLLGSVVNGTTPLVPTIVQPLESMLDRTPIGGVGLPLPVPIQELPVLPVVTGLLPVVPALPVLAEPADTPSTTRSVETASDTAAGVTRAQLPGSVPGRTPMAPAPPALPGSPSLLLVLPGVSISLLVPLDGSGGAGGPGPGNSGGPGTFSRGDNDRELPVAGTAGSLLDTRSPPVAADAITRSVPDDPSFSPD